MKNKYIEGDVFLIPLTDGSFAIGQLVKITKEALNSVICAFYDLRLETPNDYSTEFLDDGNIISVQFVTPDLLKRGVWKVVDSRADINLYEYIDLDEIIEKKYIGVDIIGSGNIRNFLSAYFGLYPWNFWFKPDYCDLLLLDHVSKPDNLIFESKE